MRELKLMIQKSELKSKISELATLINTEFKGQKIIFLGVMNGAFFMMHDLMRLINIDYDYDFLFCSSYYGGIKSEGKVAFIYPEKVNISDKKVMILEDIIDSGKTIKKISDELLKYRPESIYVSSLFLREKCVLDSIVDKDTRLFWNGYKIKNEFIVGYGLDYDEKYRNLEDIYELKVD